MYIYLNAPKYAPSESCTRDGDNGQNSWYCKVLNTWMHFSVLIIIKKRILQKNSADYRWAFSHRMQKSLSWKVIEVDFSSTKTPTTMGAMRMSLPFLTNSFSASLSTKSYLTNETQIKKTMILKRTSGKVSDQSVSPNFRGVQSKLFNSFFECFCLKLMSWLVWKVNLLNPNI